MAIINVTKTDTFDAWRVATNEIGLQIGDNSLLVANTTLSSDDLTGGLLELLNKVEYEIGNIGSLTTNSSSLVGAVNEHDIEIGVINTLTTTNKANLVSSINELDSELGVLSSLTTTTKSTIVSSINELDSELGVLSTLNTTDKGTLVGSVNSLLVLETSRYNNTLKLDLTNATVGGNNNSTQAVLSNMSMPSGKTFTIDGTLDISDGTLIIGGAGGTLDIKATFLSLGDTTSSIATSGGIIIERGTFGGNSRPDVRVYWDESTKNWSVKRLDSDGVSVITPFLIDSQNIKNLVESNTENGIVVSYNQNTNKLNFDVNDFTISLTGDVTGTATVTDLGNVSIVTTIPANRVVLGADTQGDYLSTLTSVVSSGITLTGNSGESADVTIGVDGTVVRTSGAQSISGVKTFSSKPVFSGGITVNSTSTINSLSVTNDLTVNGNFSVLGTVTTVNTETVNIADNIITLNSNYTGNTPSENGGIEIERGGQSNVSLFWNESVDMWSISDTSATYSLIGQVLAGAGMVGGGQGPSVTISHLDTSTQASVNNSAGTVIQDITLDTFGHITAINSLNLDTRYYTETESDSLYPRKNGSGASGTWSVSINGNAATASNATKLATGRTISLTGDLSGSVIFDGSSNVTLNTTSNITASGISNFVEEIQDIVGSMVSSPNIENGISIYYDDVNGKIQSDVNDFSITLAGDVTGSAIVNNLGSVTIQTAVINGSHTHDDRYYTETESDSLYPRKNGSGASGTWPVSISGSSSSAGVASRLTTARTISLTGSVTGSASFDGSANISINTSTSSLDGRYLIKTGDTMTGNLTSSSIYPRSTSAYDIGHANGRYNVMYANVFNGTASSANYADLAEKYLPDAEYEVGTVVMVGGEKEITLATSGVRALGVVSENPAFMMNRDLEGGVYIALKGRVPVKVIGPVKKGERLFATDGGYASTIGDKCDVFALALETNEDTGKKVVEAVIL